MYRYVYGKHKPTRVQYRIFLENFPVMKQAAEDRFWLTVCAIEFRNLFCKITREA